MNYNFGLKIFEFTVHIPSFLNFVNSATSLSNVGMAPNFTFRFIIPKYENRDRNHTNTPHVVAYYSVPSWKIITPRFHKIHDKYN